MKIRTFLDIKFNLQSSGSIPIITTESVDDFKPMAYSNGGMSNGNSTLSVTIEEPLTHKDQKEPPKITWTTMTPQQISIWIDK